MKNWFVIELHYLAKLEAIDAAMGDHVAFVREQHQAGHFIAWGRKVPRTGGIILACNTSKEQIEALMAKDPFVARSLVRFTVMEFSPKPEHVVQGVANLLAD